MIIHLVQEQGLTCPAFSLLKAQRYKQSIKIIISIEIIHYQDVNVLETTILQCYFPDQISLHDM